ALQGLGFSKSAVRIAAQNLKEPGHRPFGAGIRTGKNIEMPVSVDVHQLWSRAGASPHARHLGNLAFSLEPLAGAKILCLQMFVDADLSLVELADEQHFMPVAFEVGPTGGGTPRAFHANWAITRPETDRRSNSAAPTQQVPPATTRTQSKCSFI